MAAKFKTKFEFDRPRKVCFYAKRSQAANPDYAKNYSEQQVFYAQKYNDPLETQWQFQIIDCLRNIYFAMKDVQNNEPNGAQLLKTYIEKYFKLVNANISNKDPTKQNFHPFNAGLIDFKTEFENLMETGILWAPRRIDSFPEQIDQLRINFQSPDGSKSDGENFSTTSAKKNPHWKIINPNVPYERNHKRRFVPDVPAPENQRDFQDEQQDLLQEYLYDPQDQDFQNEDFDRLVEEDFVNEAPADRVPVIEAPAVGRAPARISLPPRGKYTSKVNQKVKTKKLKQGALPEPQEYNTRFPRVAKTVQAQINKRSNPSKSDSGFSGKGIKNTTKKKLLNLIKHYKLFY